MNGLKYIRERSNFTKNALADLMGVTRQTINLWEKGTRHPDKKHLKWLSDFYGIEEEFFGELSEDKFDELAARYMYFHYDDDNKEFYTFIPNTPDGKGELSFQIKEQEIMLDEKWASTQKEIKSTMAKVERSFHLENESKYILLDRIFKAKREIANVEAYLDLWEVIPKIGVKEGRFLKVPLRYEIRGVFYAMMVAYGLYTMDEIKEKYGQDFYGDQPFGKNVGLTVEEVEQIAKVLKPKWEEKKEYFIWRNEERRRKARENK